MLVKIEKIVASICFVPNTRMSTSIHTLSDGSLVRIISSKELIKIPIWKGNRVLDIDHVEKIKKAIGSNVKQLDFGYRIITYLENDASGKVVKASYIVDGQHRARVLKDFYEITLCEPDFPVVVLEKEVKSEFEVISYFNALNNSKPIKYTDVNLVINTYIFELEKAFNSKKNTYIRPKETKRPYLSAEKIREVLKLYSDSLGTSKEEILAFVEKVKKWNEEKIKSADVEILSNVKHKDTLQSASKIEFMLGVDKKMPWVRECI